MMHTKNIDLFISSLQVYSIIFRENKKAPSAFLAEGALNFCSKTTFFRTGT